jgi:hypothetical protein
MGRAMFRSASATSAFLISLLVAAPALAQTTATPPADEAAAVAAPTVPGAPPPPPPPASDTTNGAISAGGQFATGNSRLAAVTAQAKMDIRRGANAFGAALIGNYAESYIGGAPTITPGTDAKGNAIKTITPGAAPTWKESTENLQGKLRYDRYFTTNASGFLQVTGTHDAFQAVTFRLNIDPGVKLLVVNNKSTKVWGEIGYDFQYDDNYTDSNGIEQAGAGGPATDALGADYLISQNDTIHSGRLFAGFQHAFNKEVQLNLGLEYLQGFGGTGGAAPGLISGFVKADGSAAQVIKPTDTLVDPQGISLTGSRLNFNALLAANVGAGLSIGVGFQAKYNSTPLPGKEDLDTATTLTLIYSFSGSTPKPAEVKTPPCSLEIPNAPPPPPPAPPPAPPANAQPGATPAPATPAGAATAPAAATPAAATPAAATPATTPGPAAAAPAGTSVPAH